MIARSLLEGIVVITAGAADWATPRMSDAAHSERRWKTAQMGNNLVNIMTESCEGCMYCARLEIRAR